MLLLSWVWSRKSRIFPKDFDFVEVSGFNNLEISALERKLSFSSPLLIEVERGLEA